MHSFNLAAFCSLIALFLSLPVHAISGVHAPVAISLPAFSKECLYYDMEDLSDTLLVGYQVLTGGNFEIDLQIVGPDGDVLAEEKAKKYGDFLLKSFGVGQYSSCFSNSYGTALKKVEITMEKEDNSILDDPNASEEDAIANHAIEEIDRNLNKMTKIMNYLRAREWRNMSTVESTESRLTWLSLLIMGVMVAISVLQALLIQFLFSSRQKNFV